MKEKNNFPALFASEIMNGGMTSLPNMLLRFYKHLGVTDEELLVLIMLIYLRQTRGELFPSIERLKTFMTSDYVTLENNLASLIEKKVLTVTTYFDPELQKTVRAYDFNELYDSLLDLWQLEKIRKKRQAKTPELTGYIDEAASDRDTKDLFQAFEKEFGRLLSPIESSQLLDWIDNCNYPRDMILEALKRAVLRGIVNFKYIDGILREWQKQNLRTLKEISAYESRFLEKQQASRRSRSSGKEPVLLRKKRPKDDKYKDFYIT